MKKNSINNIEILNRNYIDEGEPSIKKSYQQDFQNNLEELNRFKHLLDYINDGIIVFELPSGKIADTNNPALLLLEISNENNLSLSIEEIAEKFSDSEKLITMIKNHSEIYDENQNKPLYTSLIRNDGTNLPVEISVKVSNFQKKTYSILIIRDNKEKIDAENKLILAKEEAEKSNFLKTEFLAQMSHEIRTPLNSMLNFVALMKEELEGKISDELKSCFKIIDNGSKRIMRTIDLLLDMSQVQTGNYEVHFKKIDLEKDILENLVLDFYLLSKGKNLILQFNNTCRDAFIFGDSYSISQIFLNLIENAIKYTYEGQVEINLSDESGKVIVEIKDTGIGISSDYLSQIFTPFTQEEMGYTRNFEGAGLGLALVKKYVELNNAEIEVKSIKGKGSCFTVIFEKYQN